MTTEAALWPSTESEAIQWCYDHDAVVDFSTDRTIAGQGRIQVSYRGVLIAVGGYIGLVDTVRGMIRRINALEECWRAGSEACANGIPIDESPFMLGTANDDFWRRGWRYSATAF